MSTTPSIAEIGALVGNPARANVLVALLGGRALTATELAHAARVSPQTTSGYLARLTQARLLVLQKQGRHSYYRLASPLIGRMLEGIMAVAADGPARRGPRWKGEEALRAARTCYDHLAGKLGVAIADALAARRRIVLTEDGGEVTGRGARFLTELGVDLAATERRRRAFCRPCLDWRSGAPTWPARSARPSPPDASNWAGSSVCGAAAPWPSRRPGAAASSRRSASRRSEGLPARRSSWKAGDLSNPSASRRGIGRVPRQRPTR